MAGAAVLCSEIIITVQNTRTTTHAEDGYGQ